MVGELQAEFKNLNKQADFIYEKLLSKENPESEDGSTKATV